MSKIIISQDTMKAIAFFESLTGASVKDTFDDKLGMTVMVVNEGNMARAIGKGGRNIKKIEASLKRKIKIVEFSPDLQTFVRNLIYPLKIKNAEEKEGVLTLTPQDMKTRGLLIGTAATRLRNFESIIKRYFDLETLKVV